jgi:L-fuconolactonase
MTKTIDAHAHLWDRGRFTYDWLDQEPDLPSVFTPYDLAASGEPIDGFVFIQADCDESEGYREAQWVQSMKASTPSLMGVVAFAPVSIPGAAAALQALEDLPLVVGVRRLLQSEDTSFFELPELSAGLERVARRGWTFDACVRWHQLPALLRLARKHEDLTIVVDHLGKPPISAPDRFEDWRRGLADIAQLPNTAVKISGLPAQARNHATPGFGPWIRAGLDLFGAGRSMVGSDWPVSSLTSVTRRGWFDLVRTESGATDAEWADIAGVTAERTYRLAGNK